MLFRPPLSTRCCPLDAYLAGTQRSSLSGLHTVPLCTRTHSGYSHTPGPQYPMATHGVPSGLFYHSTAMKKKMCVYVIFRICEHICVINS